MKRVLVTGASGFIGRHALGALAARGFEVHAVDRRPTDGADHQHQVDLLDRSACRELLERVRPSHLFHLAWYAVPGRFWNAPENLDWVAASASLTKAFVECGGRRIVASGTCAEYEEGADTFIESSTTIAPKTLYGVAKDAFRRVLQAYAEGVGVSWAWGRVFFLYGPGEHPNRFVPAIARALLAGRPAEMTHGRQVRDFMDVRDVAAALVATLDSDVMGPVNIASGEPVTLSDVARTLATIAGRPDDLHLDAFEAPRNEAARIVADVRRLRDEVAFRPSHALEAGLADVIEHWAKRRE